MINLPLKIDYSGKVVVITGAGGLICGAMARAFAQCGAKVAALDINLDAVTKLADELTAEGFICKGYKANVLDPAALEAVHVQVLADLGKCDVLVNGAGGNNPRATTSNEYHHEATPEGKSFFDLDADGVDFVFKLNFQGTLLPTQAFAKDMLETGGCILNISSMNAYTPLTKIPAYSAAKAGMIGLTTDSAAYLGPYGIRVNAISPGGFERTQPEHFIRDYSNLTMLKRMGRGGFDLKGAVAFLASDAAAYITGHNLVIDGGFTKYK